MGEVPVVYSTLKNTLLQKRKSYVKALKILGKILFSMNVWRLMIAFDLLECEKQYLCYGWGTGFFCRYENI